MTGSDSHKQAWGIGQPVTGTNLSTPAARPAAKRGRAAGDVRIQPGKTTRITVDLDPVRYHQLHELAAAAVTTRSVSLAAMVRAMIDVASLDNGWKAVVVDMARREGS